MQKPQVAKTLSPEDQFYLDWGRETQKASISAAIDTLQRLISLNGTMLGGSLLLWQSSSSIAWLREICCALFMFGLMSAFWGSLPTASKVDLDNPNEIKTWQVNLLRRRNRWVTISAALTTIAFCVAIAALVFTTINVSKSTKEVEAVPANKAIHPSRGSAVS